MQTDRQDLDKRYITFPVCNGSLLLTKYDYSAVYESETSCADVKKVCTLIEKSISKRPEAGDGGGVPDIPIPDPAETGLLTGDHTFAKSSELDDGRLLVIHYGAISQYKKGYIKLSLYNMPGSGNPSNIITVDIETPTGSTIYAYNDIDVITFGSDTFLIVFNSASQSRIIQGTIAGTVFTFDSYLTTIGSEQMYSVNFNKFPNGDGFALFVNKIITGSVRSMVILSYTYSGGVFTELITKQTLEAAYPVSVSVPVPPLYDPPDACGGSTIYNEAYQSYGFAMALIRETDSYYHFIGGHTQYGVINWRQIYNAHYWCFPLPAPIGRTIFVPTSIRIYKSTGNVSYWHSEAYRRDSGGLIGYLEVKRLGSTQRVVGVYPAPGDDGHKVIGLELVGNYAFPKRAFKLPAVTSLTDGGIYSISDEYFAVAVTGTGGVADFYPVIWLENNAFFGYLGEASKITLTGGQSIHLRGLTLANGRVCVLRTYSGYHSNVHLLDVSYV